MTLKCYHPGILLLAGQEGKMFMTSYIEDGILHFKVSCGHQLITFSDPKHRVDTGEVHTLEMIVSLNLDTEASVPHTCQTVIKLNGTHTMRGEQAGGISSKKNNKIKIF